MVNKEQVYPGKSVQVHSLDSSSASALQVLDISLGGLVLFSVFMAEGGAQCYPTG